MIQKADKSIYKRIEDYQNLNISEKNKPTTPYFINDRVRKDLRAMVGKGTPEEIIMEARIWEKLKGIDFDSITEAEAKEFLKNTHVGIDCSGFVVHILDYWYKQNTKKHIWSFLKIPNQTMFGWLKYKLRPVEKLGAEIITDDINCRIIELKDVAPLDLIRSKSRKANADHIMMVLEVEKDENQIPLRLKYVHSTPYFGKYNGVKFGEIQITDLTKPLEEQKWLETDFDGSVPTLEGFKINAGDNGLRRLKFIN